ncbi:MAG: outer membrane beta-barrel protein [Bacteroidetes bacterium]|nr:outer membrane beta-barrel protein [Bacteroidota bacterium]
MTEIPGDTVHLLYDKDYRALPSFRLQLVYAPFRFSSNTFLRNVELIGGIYSQSQVVKYISLISGGENTDTSGIYNYKDYKLDERFGAATLSMQFNFPVFDKVMVYGSLGGGWGIFNGLRMESKGMNQRIFQDDSINNKTIVTDIQTEAPKVFYQSTSSWQSNFLIGAKVYLTCRINLYAEYGYQSIFFLPKGHQSYHQNGQTLHFGIRFKFNPPDKSTPEKQEPKQGAFW